MYLPDCMPFIHPSKMFAFICNDMTLTHVQLVICHNTQILFCRAADQSLPSLLCLCSWSFLPYCGTLHLSLPNLNQLISQQFFSFAGIILNSNLLLQHISSLTVLYPWKMWYTHYRVHPLRLSKKRRNHDRPRTHWHSYCISFKQPVASLKD